MPIELYEGKNFILVPCEHSEEGIVSYFRKTEPDFQLCIPELYVKSIDPVTGKELSLEEDGMSYFLNYGDLFLLAVNADNRLPYINEITVCLLNCAAHEGGIIYDYLQKIKDQSSCGFKVLDSDILTKANKKYVDCFSAASLCAQLLKLITDSGDENLEFMTFLSLIFGYEQKQWKSVYTVNDLRNGMSKSAFLDTISLTMKFDSKSDVSEYHFKDFDDVVLFDLHEALRRNITVKKCENCGSLFIPSVRADEKYCYYPQINGKTCRDTGYARKVKKNEILSTYRTIYKTQNARKVRNVNNISSVDKRFASWARFAKKQLSLCQDGQITVEEMKATISGTDWLSKDEFK